MAFYGLLALFPGLGALAGAYGLFADPAAISRQIERLALLPADARELILEQLQAISASPEAALGTGLLTSLVLALWSASKGARALITAMNIVYDEREKRGLVHLYALALGFTVGIVFVGIVGLAVIGAVPVVLDRLGLGALGKTAVVVLPWLLVLAAVHALCALVYRYGPSRAEPDWRWVTPGSLLATALWAMASVAFSLFVSRFGSYNETYGALGAVVILLMWLWISGLAALIGGELNAEMEHQTARDSTVGAPRPMGRRGAYVADTLGQIPQSVVMAFRKLRRSWQAPGASSRVGDADRRRGSRRRRWAGIVLVVLALGVAVRAVLPWALERYVNRVIDRTESYAGSIDDVDVQLLRGGYTIEGLRLDHETVEWLRPLLSAERIELMLQWGPLLRGELVGEIDAYGVVYNIVAAPPSSDEVLAQTGEDPELGTRVSEFFPFALNRFEIHDGEVHYRDPHREPAVDVALREVELLALNWSNARDVETDRFGRAWLRARAFRSARLVASLEADPLASPPEFTFAAVTQGIVLVELNEMLRAYASFDAEAGQLALYTELDATDGSYRGYLKPLIRDLDVVGRGDDDNWAQRVWEGAVGVVAELFQNQFTGRQATRIPIEGEWGEPVPDLLTALVGVLRNAFIDSLTPTLEHPERLAVDAPGEGE
jgi:membrane protein